MAVLPRNSSASDHGYAPLQARVMFEGEAASLQALLQTNTVHVPKPIKVQKLSDLTALGDVIASFKN